MQLTHSTDLALRVLMLTAARESLITIRELAETLEVPATHMAKIVQRLQHLDLVVTTRGRAGGVHLAPDTRPRRVGQIVRALEGPGEVIDCDAPPCPLRGACRLRGALRQAQESFLVSLDSVALADLVGPPTGPALLSLGPARH
ncbi:Rrf2 family transcriptional regulator [Frankia sp. CNm7]|uniref:Rrf2 family transcriptional regulator n=1 Tax=Frankia nepalensis TaxID=1836974 RepID=A0A937RGQ5_9ACTN|nr:Rrf2 family transcriptional regulator [Frankia nepalensis]MBL7499341.1 Rrf2 family transcriptional regulator [Frankia nepalensis]MBL7515211.1 Rrf2 family transcriptional regulator [Frankia nepalensis]MBL7524002.1 Rrf2 family transcriptional regulator [Frankia nepalensis]MBL7629887.1 Rrf2 family transcriptional regulator [Frankia nepalensis]